MSQPTKGEVYAQPRARHNTTDRRILAALNYLRSIETTIIINEGRGANFYDNAFIRLL